MAKRLKEYRFDLWSSICSIDGSRSKQIRRIGIVAGNRNNLERILCQSHLLFTKLRLCMTVTATILLCKSDTLTGLHHICDVIQQRRSRRPSAVVRIKQRAPAHVSLKLCRDPPRWLLRLEDSNGSSMQSDQLKKDRGNPVLTLWTRAQHRSLRRRNTTAFQITNSVP
jgi:hypothetical protein